MTTAGPILVLGASGRIGRLLRQCWGADLQAHIRWQTRNEIRGETGWLRFDPLKDPAALAAAARGCAQILCLAGPVPGSGARSEPGSGASLGPGGAAMQPHIDLACAAVEAAEPGARVLLASSAAVYGPRCAAREDQPLTPANAYGQAKAEMEARALARGRELDVRVTSLRIGNIAGFDAALGGWRPGFTLDRFADGSTPRRSYIGPGVLADVLATLLARPDLPAALNIAQPGPVAMGDLLQAAGRDFATRPAPETALPEVTLDLSRLQGLLGADLPDADLSRIDLPDAEAAALVADWNATQTGPKKETS